MRNPSFYIDYDYLHRLYLFLKKSTLTLSAVCLFLYGFWFLCQTSREKNDLTIKVNTIFKLRKYNVDNL